MILVAAAQRKTGLRVAKASDKPASPVARMSVAQAADSGDHRALLVAMRERIARAVADPDCPPRDLASLTRRLQDIAKEIESIDLRVKQEAREDAHVDDEAYDAAAL